MAYFGNQHISSTNTFYSLDSSVKKYSYRFTCRADLTLPKLKIRTTITTGTSPTYRIGLQGDSGGNPDGTWLGATNSAYGDYQLIGNVWETIILGENVSLVESTIYHIVIEFV